jgi:hypothetical protein
MGKIAPSHDYIILDACCVINLFASGKMPSILETIPDKFAIAHYIIEKEALAIYGGPDGDVMQTKKVIDLSPFVGSSLLTLASPSYEDEYMDFVNFTRYLDDGEAITGAIAKYRSWGIGIDEKRGISFFRREIPQLPLLSTAELIKYWADSANPSGSLLSDVIQNIRSRARYSPGKGHPLYQWWEDSKSSFWS